MRPIVPTDDPFRRPHVAPRWLSASSDALLLLSGAVSAWALARPLDGTSAAAAVWSAAHAAATGGSPYAGVWPYPPLTAWLFAPLTLVDAAIAVPVLELLFLVVAVVGIVAAIVSFGPEDRPTRVLLLTAAVVSQAFAFDVRSATFLGLLLIGIVLVKNAAQERGVVSLIVGMLLLSLRPMVLLPFAAAALVMLARRGRIVAIVLTVLAVGAAVAAAMSRDALAAPAVSAWVSGTVMPAPLFRWSVSFTSEVGLLARAVVGLACVGLAAVATSWAPDEDRVAALLAASLAAGVVIVPGALPHDVLLVLPALAIAARIADRVGKPVRIATLTVTALALSAGTWADLLVAPRVLPLAPVLLLPPLAVAALALTCAARRWSWARERDVARSRLADLTARIGRAG